MSEDLGAVPSKDDVLQWVVAHGDMLFGYAVVRVGDRDVAEDLVQETFLSAVRGLDDFHGGSQIQTWLFAILRNKIIDHFRRENRRREFDTASREAESFAQLQFFRNGHWRTPLKDWTSDPSKLLESQEFMQTFTNCQAKLSPSLEIAIRLRDVEGLPTEEICELLGISAGSLWVRLHRARLLLRDCLDKNWFSD